MSWIGTIVFWAAAVPMSSTCIAATFGPLPLATAAGSFWKKSAHW